MPTRKKPKQERAKVVAVAIVEAAAFEVRSSPSHCPESLDDPELLERLTKGVFGLLELDKR